MNKPFGLAHAVDDPYLRGHENNTPPKFRNPTGRRKGVKEKAPRKFKALSSKTGNRLRTMAEDIDLIARRATPEQYARLAAISTLLNSMAEQLEELA